MKNLIRKSLVIISMFVVMLGHTSETVTDSTNENKQSRLVSFTDVEKGSILLIKDVNKKVLYREKINKEGPFAKKFDFKNLPDGSYYFELEDTKEISILPFTTIKGMAAFEEEAKRTISKPEVKQQDEMVLISNTSSEEQNLDVHVYYKGSELAFKEVFKDQKKIARTYDFSSSLKGDYTIVLSTEGRTFVNKVSIP